MKYGTIFMSLLLLAGTASAKPKPNPIKKKLNNIMIPEVEFKEVSIEEAVKWIRSASFKYDTESKEKGLNIVLMNHLDAAGIGWEGANTRLQTQCGPRAAS